MSNGLPHDPDDYFHQTRMSFGDHIEDLRTHLWRAVKGFMVAMVLALCVGHIVVEWIKAPVSEQLGEFYRRRQAKVMKEKDMVKGVRANQPTPFRILRIPTKQIEQLVPQRQSLMPDLLLRDMTAQQVADLLEYLSNLK